MTTTHKKLLTKAQAIEVFNGKVTDLAEALGLTRQAIYAWDERAIPERHDMKIRYELHPKKTKKILSNSNRGLYGTSKKHKTRVLFE